MAKERNLFQRLWHSWCVDLTPSARGLILAGLLALMLGSTTTYVDTYLVVGFWAILGVNALICVFLFQPHLEIESTLPHRVVAKQKIKFSILIRNKGATVAKDVSIHPVEYHNPCELEPIEYNLLALPPEKEEILFFQACFPRRGIFHFYGFWADTIFPFAWLRMGKYHDPRSINIIVCPDFTPLQTLHIPTGRRYQPGGIAFASKLGDSTEYRGNREYQPGDSLRSIDWLAWARSGQPMVKEYQEEYFCRIALIMDTYLPKSQKRKQDFEGMLSLAASITDYLSRQEYLLDIFTAGPQIYILEAGRSLAHMENILDVLACLEPQEQTYVQSVDAIIQKRIELLTTIVLFFPTPDPLILECINKWEQSGVGVKAILCNTNKPMFLHPTAHLDFHCYSANEIATITEI